MSGLARYDDTAAVRDALDPWTLCEGLGLLAGPRRPPRQARGLFICCPFEHAERTPSCSVTVGPDGGVRVRCFGCGATSDAFGLVAAVHGLDVRKDFRRVLELSAALAGIQLTHAPRGVHYAPPPRRRPPPPPPPTLDAAAFGALVALLARLCPLEAQADVAAYVRRRGVLERVAGRWFALPARAAELERVRAAAVALLGAEGWALSGLARRDNGGWLWREHRLCVPWCAPDGAVTTLQRRVVRPLRDDEPLGKYMFASNRAPQWPYGVEALGARGGSAVAFVEGAVDAEALGALAGRAGRDWTPLALPSASDWRATWAGLATGREALVGLDADGAGERAVGAIGADLRAAGAATVRRVRPPGAKDWGELLERERAHG